MGTQRKGQPSKCLVCKLNKVQSRGCCGGCGTTLRRLIDLGERTEQELIDKGLMLPRQKTGRPLGSKARQRIEAIDRRLAKSGK